MIQGDLAAFSANAWHFVASEGKFWRVEIVGVDPAHAGL